MTASTSFSSTEGLTFRVEHSTGSEMVIKRVLLAALTGEQDLWRRHEPQRAALTAANYTFAPADDEVTPTRIGLEPRRRDRLLVAGAMFVDPPDGDLMRVRDGESDLDRQRFLRRRPRTPQRGRDPRVNAVVDLEEV